MSSRTTARAGEVAKSAGRRTSGVRDVVVGEQRELTNVPWMLRGKNGKQYFGINVHWESGQYGSWDRFHLGLRKLSDAWEVEWDEKTFEIPLDDLSKLDALFAALVKASTNVYDAPITESASTIGFVPTTRA